MNVFFTNLEFFVVGFLVAPALLFYVCRRFLPRRWGRWMGALAVMMMETFMVVGSFFGFQQLEIRHLTYESADIPEAFDGYRIVQFSDAHVGTMTGYRKWMLESTIDSILAQRADMIVFTGDLQNIQPKEIQEQMALLSRLKAPDGVISVLGNHDYGGYLKMDSAAMQDSCLMTQQLERKAGWDLLMNEHRVVRRGGDSIVIGGMENWSDRPEKPRHGDARKTLRGVGKQAFVIMLEHDPTAWREKILPDCHAQLTLSGHTHGGQMAFFGWSPVAFSYDEYDGRYDQDGRTLYISTGIGGLIPFRFEVPREFTVITLKRKSH